VCSSALVSRYWLISTRHSTGARAGWNPISNAVTSSRNAPTEVFAWSISAQNSPSERQRYVSSA
jgi:hypothetical protein